MSNENNIYVASLSDYNAGILHGKWINLDNNKTYEEVMEEVKTMLAASPTAKEEGLPAEEWAIHDFELPFKVEEFTGIEEIITQLELIEEHGNAWLAWVNIVGEHYATLENFEDNFIGEYESLEDYCWQYIEDTGVFKDCPMLENYFDMEAYARDVSFDINSWDIEGICYIFTNH